MLADEDRAWLTERGFTYEVVSEGGMTNLILKDYQLPVGFNRDHVDLLVRLGSAFPDTPPDMFWVDPPVLIQKTGAHPPATEQMETHAGRQWQRFSRHFPAGSWRAGTDSLESWILCIRHLLERDVSA